MLDPFTSLSVASEVLQCVDFLGKFISQGYSLYKSTDGISKANAELESIVLSLDSLVGQIPAAEPTANGAGSIDLVTSKDGGRSK